MLALGYRIGSSPTATKYVVLEIHYDNPEFIEGLVDDSGVRIYYTPQLRQYDAGTIMLGDIYPSFLPIEAGKQG